MSTSLVRAVPLLILLTCWIPFASAEEEIAEIGGTTVGFVAPDGWCTLEPGKISDARVIGVLQEGIKRVGNTFVVAFADCGELELWRSGRQRTLDNYGVVAYNNALREFVHPGTDASFVQELREAMDNAGQEYIDDLVERGAQLMEDVLPMAKLGTPTNLGTIGEDEISVYQGGIMPLETELGDPKVSVYSNASTLLRKKMVFTYLFTVHDDDRTLSRLLEDHKYWTERLRAANRNLPNLRRGAREERR